ncbi:AAEL013611-PA [Aedes aegypti]|uniref:AAEL013611-PA n=2 Tax=Aedes aegypti TaxID=7159 RepID=A0A1S4FZQ9_AEDAE|nr:probable 4-coumarate--CoA ligase 3 [Aedes aegypti]EAT34122.1 AAEL013611-PA [Aedes aegypti]
MSRYDPTTRTWHGSKQPPVLNPAASIGQVIVNILERTPNNLIQIDAVTGEEYTCDKLRIQMIRTALNLTQVFKISKGDMVCMVLDNRSCVMPLLFGCFLVGAPVHTLDSSFEESDLTHLIGITKPKLVFCTEHNQSTVQNAIKLIHLEAQVVVLDGSENHKRIFAPHDAEKLYRPPYLGDSNQTTAVVVCSSGTTGLPKAVCVTHSQLIAPYSMISHMEPSTVLCFSSLYWISAFQMLLLTVFNGFKRVITTRAFSPAYACELVKKYEVTNAFVPPPMLAEIVEYCEVRQMKLPTLKMVGVGGSALPDSLRKRANALSPNGRVFVGYAMSETGGIMSLDLLQKPNSVGILMPNVSMRIAADDGILLGPDEEGEIQIRYIHPFVGYYGNDEATQALLTPDSFIKTGDIGYFDQAGFLFITDRKKEMIRYRGYQIAPAQLEALLMEMPGIVQAVVVATPDKKPPHDELPTALVVRGSDETKTVSKQDILEYVHGKVPDYKQLRGGVFFVKSLPKTANGKINRKEAKKMVPV